jgi:hypothetical protein
VGSWRARLAWACWRGVGGAVDLCPGGGRPAPVALWRKDSFGLDSAAASRFAERLLTVAATCRQQGRPLLAFLVAAGEAALQGTAAPSLLPAPQGD